MPDGCPFCKIVAGNSPATVVHRDERLTAIRDINPQAPTHILILPNRHLVSLSESFEGDEPVLGALLRTAAELAAREGIAGSGYRLVVNTGADAGQSVNHLHIHLLGGRRMRWPPG